MVFRFVMFFMLSFVLAKAHAQEDTSAYHTELKAVKIFRPNSTYSFYLKRVQKLYPYALYAADVIHQLDDKIEILDKKRQIKKVSKETQKALFDEFDYMIRDLYASEGRLLMKLINRETGMTVNEIIGKYRGKLQSTIYSTMAKMFHQDLKIKYQPQGEDKLIEKIIQDIQAESVYFDPEYKEVTKQDFKQGMKVYRMDKKEARQKQRAEKMNKRKARKEEKRKKN